MPIFPPLTPDVWLAHPILEICLTDTDSFHCSEPRVRGNSSKLTRNREYVRCPSRRTHRTRKSPARVSWSRPAASTSMRPQRQLPRCKLPLELTCLHPQLRLRGFVSAVTGKVLNLMSWTCCKPITHRTRIMVTWRWTNQRHRTTTRSRKIWISWMRSCWQRSEFRKLFTYLCVTGLVASLYLVTSLF